MSVEISTQIIHASFASVINSVQQNANIYDNPNQQGTAYPAWFIVHRSPVEVQKELGKRNNGNRYLLTFQIDIWYMLQQNITRLFDQYSQMAEALEYKLQYLPIFGSDAVVQVYDRSWSMELNALKYSTTLKLRVYTDEKFVFTPMEVIEDLSVFLKNQKESIITFTNSTHPEFEPDFPKSMSVTTGRNVNLPYVSGKFEDETFIWTPSRWTLGEFGELIQVNENLTAGLEWTSRIKTATITFSNSEHPEFSVDLPQPITEDRGSTVTLPTIEATYPIGPIDWRTVGWNIGDFGSDYLLEDDVTATLQWTNQEILYTLTYTNTTKPEFDIWLPEPVELARGNHVLLPTIYGVYYEDTYEWRPTGWDIGEFGADIEVRSNLTANLLWESREVTVYPQGELISGDMQIDPSIITRLSAVNIGNVGIGTMNVGKPQVSNGSMLVDSGLALIIAETQGLMELE